MEKELMEEKVEDLSLEQFIEILEAFYRLDELVENIDEDM